MAESAVVAFLRDNGFLQAERRALKGSLDQGDVTGTPGLCWEVKYADGGIRMGAWVAQTEVERVNSGSDYGILVIKPRGLGARSTGNWFAVMSMAGHEALLEPVRGQCIVAGPVRYTAATMAVELRNHKQFCSAPLAALTVVPPGAIGQPLLQYRVMTLRDMVQLVRFVGYGEEHDRVPAV